MNHIKYTAAEIKRMYQQQFCNDVFRELDEQKVPEHIIDEAGLLDQFQHYLIFKDR